METKLTPNLFFENFNENQVIKHSYTTHGKSSAIYTDDFKSRIFLSRIWYDSPNFINFIMLNPSTATHEKLDPTVTRCYNWAREWGFSGMFITNIFGYRSTNPRNLKITNNPVGSGNDEAIRWSAKNANKIIVAWGVNGSLLNRDKEVLVLLKKYKVYALKLTKNSVPSHPLYLPKNIKPVLL